MPPITQNSKVGFTIGALLTLALSLVVGTWTVTRYLTRFEQKLDAAIANQWTKSDHERFAQKLERGNRKIDLVVPDVNDRS